MTRPHAPTRRREAYAIAAARRSLTRGPVARRPAA